MSASLQGKNPPNANADPEVAATVRLLHRRRGWAWTAGGSLIALVAFFAIGEQVSPNPTGAASTILVLIITALVVLCITALSIAGADTARLRRLHPAVRTSAASRRLCNRRRQDRDFRPAVVRLAHRPCSHLAGPRGAAQAPVEKVTPCAGQHCRLDRTKT